jgi:hypothetical protein
VDPFLKSLREGQGARFCGIGKQDDEFVSTITKDEIRAPSHCTGALGKLDQDLVAPNMTEGVVDAFEVVQINQ